MSRRAQLSVLIASLTLFACADKTAIFIEVRSDDLSVPADVDTLRFIVTSNTATMVDRTYTLDGAWPHSLTVVPASALDREVTVDVIAFSANTFVARRVVHSGFVPGQTVRLGVLFSRACVGVICPEGIDCVGGVCMEPPPQDSGMPDTGTGDSGPRDSGPRDSGPRDTGVPDSNLDTGPLDTGMPDTGPRDTGTPDAGAIRCDGSSCIGLIVLSEFRTRGPGSAGDEFVEIYNRSSTEVDVSGLQLRYQSASGATPPSTRATVGAGVIMPAGSYLLFANTAYGGTPDVADRWTTGFADPGGTLLLRAGGGRHRPRRVGHRRGVGDGRDPRLGSLRGLVRAQSARGLHRRVDELRRRGRERRQRVRRR